MVADRGIARQLVDRHGDTHSPGGERLVDDAVAVASRTSGSTSRSAAAWSLSSVQWSWSARWSSSARSSVGRSWSGAVVLVVSVPIVGVAGEVDVVVETVGGIGRCDDHVGAGADRPQAACCRASRLFGAPVGDQSRKWPAAVDMDAGEPTSEQQCAHIALRSDHIGERAAGRVADSLRAITEQPHGLAQRESFRFRRRCLRVAAAARRRVDAEDPHPVSPAAVPDHDRVTVDNACHRRRDDRPRSTCPSTAPVAPRAARNPATLTRKQANEPHTPHCQNPSRVWRPSDCIVGGSASHQWSSGSRLPRTKRHLCQMFQVAGSAPA